ncbi:hypothetical protein ACGFY8_12505 [Streptomyces sp. NPDC048232]|uniref:hypothetical protein n=1 Tax=Streptomyces sp. NPDC048232 TaxID=3365520 RepID=UPI0037162E28
MSTRNPALVALAVALLTGCGQTKDDLFSNLNGTGSQASTEAPASGEAPHPDIPPNHADNQRARQPGEMSPGDEGRARRLAAEVESALGELSRHGRTAPADVRTTLTRLAAPDRVTVDVLIRGSGAGRAAGSSYGVGIGETACITGAVTEDRVWVEVNGPYPETGCLPPAPAH